MNVNKNEGDPWENLANAIILQVVADYKTSRRRLEKHPNNVDAQRVMGEVMRFFHSKWYEDLTSVPADYLIASVNKRMAEEDAEKEKKKQEKLKRKRKSA